MTRSPSPPFIPGLQLSRRFYWEVVRPILDRGFPRLPHSAALIGSGSEVLGFDDSVSRDHHWGPRLQLFLRVEDHTQHSSAIDAALRRHLPYEFLGYSTNFSEPNPEDNNTQLLAAISEGPVNHRVQTLTLRGYIQDYLGYDVREPLTPEDWLTFPMQKLRTLSAGEVYYDGVGLQDLRRRFAHYPHDVWLYLLAAGWSRMGQEEHLMGRAGQAGDEIGSTLIASRLVRDIMRLGFLMERQYPPYAKWFGTAFRQLACADELMPALTQTLQAVTWQEREAGLAPAYETLARKHNAMDLTQPMPEHAVQFHGRPFKVMAIQGFADALLQAITVPDVQHIASRPPIGSIDLFSDNTDMLESASLRTVVRRLYT